MIAWPPPTTDTGRAMSQENVEVVRASIEAWNAGDMDVAIVSFTTRAPSCGARMAGRNQALS